MKICHIITRLIVGGAQENTLLTCAGLCAKGHDVTLVSGPETGPEGSLWDEARLGGYELVTLDSMRRNINPVNDLRAFAGLRRIIGRGRFDVVHTHSSKAGILGRLAATKSGAAVVHTIHGMSFNRTQRSAVRRLYRGLEQYAAKRTDRLVSVADAMTAQAVVAGLGPAERFVTVRSGMETDRFSPDSLTRAEVRAEWGVAEGEVVIGTVARLFVNKGYEDLLKIMPRVAGECPKARFVWVGDGPNRDEYLRRARGMGLADRVYLTGLVRPGEVPRLMNGMDMLLHASYWEGLPRAVVQALLMRVPVVSYDNDGAPEVVLPNRTGELVPFGDVEGLAEGTIRLASSAERRVALGTEGRRRCMTEFDHRRMVDQLEALYVSLRGGVVRGASVAGAG